MQDDHATNQRDPAYGADSDPRPTIAAIGGYATSNARPVLGTTYRPPAADAPLTAPLPTDAPEDELLPGSTFTVEAGWWVIVTVSAASTLPYCCYVGETQAVDEQGVRVRQVNWETGLADQYDIMLPWRLIDGIVCCTESHALAGFLDYARDWASRAAGDELLATNEPPYAPGEE